MKTTDVPRPDRKVTGLPNMMTDSQMSRTRLAVLATLEMANMYQGGCRSTEEAKNLFSTFRSTNRNEGLN